MFAATLNDQHSQYSQAACYHRQDKKNIQQKLAIPGHVFEWLVQIGICLCPGSMLNEACTCHESLISTCAVVMLVRIGQQVLQTNTPGPSPCSCQHLQSGEAYMMTCTDAVHRRCCCSLSITVFLRRHCDGQKSGSLKGKETHLLLDLLATSV